LSIFRTRAIVLLAAIAGGSAAVICARAQTGSASPAVPLSNLVVLDPAHGASDLGAVFADHSQEKDVTLAMAGRVRTALASAGYAVAMTRDADPSDPLASDQRAEIANRSHALACVVLHATAAGSGVHIYTSTLPVQPPDPFASSAPAGFVPVPWDAAQSAYAGRSASLAANVAAAFRKAGMRAMIAQAPLRPLDNLMCPAIAIELAPRADTPVSDVGYQQQVAAALVTAIRHFREQAASQTASPGRAIPAASAGAGRK
jgi:N-acetylmuramoyl-L-alanine amidase